MSNKTSMGCTELLAALWFPFMQPSLIDRSIILEVKPDLGQVNYLSIHLVTNPSWDTNSEQFRFNFHNVSFRVPGRHDRSVRMIQGRV